MIILSNDDASNIPNAAKTLSGGRARFARSFSRYLDNQGHQWIGVVSKLSNANQSKIIPLGKKSGHKSYWHLQIPMKYHQKIRSAGKTSSITDIFSPAIDRCSDLIKKTKPDIIFINGNSIYPWIFLQAGQKTNTPIVTQHAGIMKISTDRVKKYHPRTFLKILHRVEKNFSQLSDKNVFISRLSRKKYNKKVKRIKKENTVIISLPYDPIFIEKKIKPKKNYKIGIVASWNHIKNHQAVVELAKLAKQKDLPWKFYAVTEIVPDRKLKSSEEKYIKHIKIEKQKDRSALKRFYQKMDLMILPSHFETLGFVVMEAALAGTGTIISPKVGWIDDYKKLGMSDWVVDFKNPKIAIKKIEKIIGHNVPKKFYNFLLKNNNPEHIFNQYLKLFKEVIKNHS